MGAETKYIYILFSATPYRIGRMIRFVTGEPYNHVAIAMEDDLKELYAFARRYYRTPFYGGFVTEQPNRYHHKGASADIRLCRLPVTREQWEELNRRLMFMRSHAYRYLYNHLSAMAAPFHYKVDVRDAYTCAEFTVSVLQELGFDFTDSRYYSICDIAERLDAFCCYEGEFPIPPEENTGFFDPHPVRHPIYASTRDLLRLLWRKAIA